MATRRFDLMEGTEAAFLECLARFRENNPRATVRKVIPIGGRYTSAYEVSDPELTPPQIKEELGWSD